MNSLLLVGHNGFIGKNLTSKYREHDIKITPINSRENNLYIKQTPTNAITLINCAGSSSVYNSFNNPQNDFESSIHITGKIINSMLKLNDQFRNKLITISSAAVYGKNTGVPLRETDTLQPISPYGINKKIVENILESYQNHINADITIIRPFSIYGNGQKKQLIWDTCNKIITGECEFFGTGEEMRDWLHVEDLSSLIYLISKKKSKQKFQIFNAGNQLMSVGEIIEMLAYYMGKKIKPVFNGLESAGNPKHLIANHEKTQEYLDWTPQISLDQGLKKYVSWFLSNRTNN